MLTKKFAFALTVAAAAAAVSAGSAFAQSKSVDQGQSVTRAQVRAEMIQAQKDGTATINQNDAMIGQPNKPFVSTKSRAEVKQELAASGSINHSDGNVEDYPYQRPFVSTRSRQDVRNEATMARNTVHAQNADLYRGS
ncbi:MAG: DUF4148 domain-containing protein [Janthinobacterium lividum]